MRFVVVKTHSRAYGYSLKNTGKPLSWITGPGQTFAWYKYKKDAISRANEFNNLEKYKEV
jgi:hypothetical protein